ncbi:tetratricopeptide repeat protein [Azospirillum doebereinerae]
MSIGAWFAEALGHHQSGDLNAAEPLYLRILDADPNHADALHLLGVLKHQQGRNGEALDLIERSIGIDNSVADVHGNLGLVLQALGRLDDAVAAQERAIARNPGHAGAHFNLGLALTGLGRRELAALHYAEAARLSPALADAHLNLGAVLQDLGRAEEALAAHARAAALLPDDPRPWTNLAVSLRHLKRFGEAAEAVGRAMERGGKSSGEATTLAALASNLHAAGRLEEAAGLYADALRGNAGNPIVLNNLGLVLKALNRLDDAASCFDAAVAADPGFADALDNLGTLRAEQGRVAEAEALHRTALRHRPDLAGAWNNLGNARKSLGRTETALPAWRVAIALDPYRAEVYSNLGNGLREGEDFVAAEMCHGRAVRLTPGEATPRNNHGHALQGRQDFTGASLRFHKALALDPAYAEAWSNLGLARQRLGEPAAERCYDRALRLRPDLPLAHFNKGLLRLEAGDMAAGWPGYAWRFAAGQVGAGRQPRAPAWRGEELAGRRLMVWGEQGVGDSILFSALAAEIAVRTRSTVMEVDRRLVPLFARSFPGLTVRAEAIDARGRETMAIPDYDRHVPMGSLPRILRGSLSAFPQRNSWLVPDPTLVAGWHDRLAGLEPGLTVGIGWRSQILTAERSAAYVGLDQWGPLFAVPGVRWVVLQYGDCENEVAEAERRFGVRLRRWGDLDRKDDFDGVAALIANLDLVISPAMSVGELAGALGTPVWRFGTRDWTQIGSGVRPWFPAMRLFQPRPGEALPDTLGRMAVELRALGPVVAAPVPPPAPNLGTVLHAMGRRAEAQACLAEAVGIDGGALDARLGLGALLNDLGRPAEAEEHYRAALALDAADPDAQAGLGAALFQRGRHAEAAGWLEHAVAAGVRRAATLDLLGAAHRLTGRADRAERWHGEAVAADPLRAATRTNFGLALGAQARWTEAAERHRQALALSPAFPEALNNLGVALQALDGERAVLCHRRAVRLRPASAESWGNLAAALLILKRHAESAAAAAKASALAPALAGALTTGGAALKGLGRFVEAARDHRRALRVTPSHAKAWSNLGTALAGLSRWDEALAAQHRALALAPALADAHLNLGHAEQVLGRFDAARRHAERTLRLAPGRSDARMNRALLRLASGDLVGGWRDYAARFASGESLARRFSVPEWQGEDLSRETILVWGEQGLGDEIMFGTVLPDLMARAGRVIVECDARLVRLFARVLPDAVVRPPTVNPRDCDRHAAMGSVAALLRPGLGRFPSRAALLAPDPTEAARWSGRLASLGPGLTVGVCWRSSRITADRAGAYTRLDQWGPLFAVPGLRFVNLQYDDCAAELDDARARFGTVLHTWPDLDPRNDLDAVAALVAGLDLVVTAPTSVGELAAAVGTPVWRLSGPGDWSRLGTGVRPWFPAMATLGSPGGDHGETLAFAARRLRAMMAPPAPKSGGPQN